MSVGITVLLVAFVIWLIGIPIACGVADAAGLEHSEKSEYLVSGWPLTLLWLLGLYGAKRLGVKPQQTESEGE